MLTSLDIARILREQKKTQKKECSGFDSALKDLGVVLQSAPNPAKSKE